MPDVPFPDTLPPLGDHFLGYEDDVKMFVDALKPIDMRYANDPAWIMKGTGERAHPQPGLDEVGRRPARRPAAHVVAMGYSSDTTVLDSIITTHGLSWG